MTAASKSEQYPSRPPAQVLAAEVADLFCSLGKALFDPYRPERHYMRGPGPKWHAMQIRRAGAVPRPCGADDDTSVPFSRAHRWRET
jgi:hypothetical protein